MKKESNGKKSVVFTNEEFRELLLLLEIGTYIKESIDERDGTGIEHSRDLLEKLYALAEEYDAGDLVQEFRGRLICSDEMSRLYHDKYIEEYNNDQFWHELERRLAHRDFDLFASEEEKKKVKENDGWMFGIIDKYLEKYEKEFEEFGVERLFIDESASESHGK